MSSLKKPQQIKQFDTSEVARMVTKLLEEADENDDDHNLPPNHLITPQCSDYLLTPSIPPSTVSPPLPSSASLPTITLAFRWFFFSSPKK